MEPKEPKRAIVEYKETSADGGKPIRFKMVIESAKDADDVRDQFWRLAIWATRTTEAISIVSITWPDEE